MSDVQDRLERAYYALIDVENAKRKVDRAYEQALDGEEYQYGVAYIGGEVRRATYQMDGTRRATYRMGGAYRRR